MPNKSLLSAAEVAEMMNRDTSIINRWVRAGKITPTVEGRGVRGARFFDPDEVERVKNELQKK